MTGEMLQAARRSVRWADCLVPFLPAALASQRARARLRPALAALPDSAATHVYLECRLRGDDDQVDVIAGLPRTMRSTLLTEPWSPDHDIRRSPGGMRIGRFLHRWAVQVRDLDPIDWLWLEYDLPTHRELPSEMTPSLFIELSRNGHDKLAGPWLSQVKRFFRGLTGADLHEDVANQLDFCHRHVQPHASIPYVGIMVGRSAAPVRLCLLGPSSEELRAYLGRIAWQGDARLLANVLDAVGAMYGTGSGELGLVHIDVGAAVSPRIGIEYVFQRRRQLDGDLAERGLLDSLVGWGLCTRAKRDALLRWPGYSVGCQHGELWASVFVRRVNNIKIVIESDGSVQAKGYLCASKSARCELRERNAYDSHWSRNRRGQQQG